MYIYICICMYVFIYYLYMYIFIYVHIYIHIHTYIVIYIYTYMYILRYIYEYKYTIHLYTCIYTSICIFLGPGWAPGRVGLGPAETRAGTRDGWDPRQAETRAGTRANWDPGKILNCFWSSTGSSSQSAMNLMSFKAICCDTVNFKLPLATIGFSELHSNSSDFVAGASS